MTRSTNELVEMGFKIDTRRLNVDERTVDATLSTSDVVDMGFGIKQRLAHGPNAIDMIRAKSGLALLFNHDQDRPIGRVNNIRSDGDKLKGTLKFSSNKDAESVFNDVRDGILTDISIGYKVDVRSVDIETEPGVHNVGRWTPAEVSVVTVPADPRAGIQRNYQELFTMSKSDENPGNLQLVKDEAIAEGRKLEKQRQVEIRGAFDLVKLSDSELLNECLDNAECTVDQARAMILKKIGENNQGNITTGSFVQVGEEAGEKRSLAMQTAVLGRAGYDLGDEEKRSLQGNEFVGMSMRELARDCLEQANVSTRGLNAHQIIGKALTLRSTIGHSTSDFDGVLENTANKFLLQGFDSAGTTWREISRVMPITDFKATSVSRLQSYPALPVVPAGAEFSYGTVGDVKETITLLTYGSLFSITRQALVNDDLAAFSDIPRRQGLAADRTINSNVYSVLTANAALGQDSTTLFHADHNNIGTGGVISVTTVDEMRTLMRKQTDGGNSVGMNNDIAKLIVPAELEGRANVLRTSQVDPIGLTGALAGAQAANPEQNRWDVVADATLSATSALVYYAMSNPNTTDTIISGFLDGQTTPFLESENGFTVDGVTWKVRIDHAAIAADYRGMARNAGA